jgi:hypothetical protein
VRLLLNDRTSGIIIIGRGESKLKPCNDLDAPLLSSVNQLLERIPSRKPRIDLDPCNIFYNLTRVVGHRVIPHGDIYRIDAYLAAESHSIVDAFVRV